MNLIDKIEAYSSNENNVAQIYREKKFTYKDLKEKSDALAYYLIELMGADKSPIIIYGHKQEEMLISFFACTKSGHAYVPLDITFPSSRVMDIVKDTGSKILIKVSELDGDFGQDVTVIELKDLQEIFKNNVGKKPDKEFFVQDDDNYYILFTSGSTGKPKGVQITKKCVESFVNCFYDECSISKDKNIILNQVSYSFDVSVISIYIGLMMGKTLYVIDKEMATNYADLFKYLNKSDIALWISTPSFIEICLFDDSFNSKLMPKLEKFIFAGEVLTKKLVSELNVRFEGSKIINGYGPTEATVLITAAEITPSMLESKNPLPIGYPLSNGKHLILDKDENSVKVGEKGELVFIGDNVSPGYFNNKELTEKAFFDYAIDSEGKRGYRTGDLVYEDENGLIYFCGRKDLQVKLNGYRIEIEDIENNIRNLSYILNAVVLPVYKEEKLSHLAAFVVLKERFEVKEFKIVKRIKEDLGELIQSYMIPRTIKIKDKFPMNTNGKIDRKLLMEELN